MGSQTKLKTFLRANKTLLIWMTVVLVLLAAAGGGITYTLKRKHEIRQAALAKGLGEITIIKQTQSGQTKKLNITETAFRILGETLSNNGRVDTKAKKEVNQLSISDVEFPPIPVEHLKTYEGNGKQDIANYFQKTYNILNTKHGDITVENIASKALKRQKAGKNLTELQTVNEDMYYDLVNMDVPQEALPVHKSYIRIVQLHHHFIQSVIQRSDDPLGTKTNSILAFQVLEELRPKLNKQISNLAETYDLQLQKQKQASEPSEQAQ